MEHYLAIKRKDVLAYAIIWMNHEHTLSERSQTEKAMYCMVLRIEISRIAQATETENKEGGIRSDCLMSPKFSFGNRWNGCTMY